MAGDFEFRGIEKFAQVARDLKAAGDKDLRRELYRGLNRATKPLKEAAKANTAAKLPQRGGLAARVSRARYSTKGRAGKNPSVSIVVKDSKNRSVDLKAIDAGQVRHPTFKDGPWVTQPVPAGTITDPMMEGVDDVRVQLLAAIDAVATKLAQG